MKAEKIQSSITKIDNIRYRQLQVGDQYYLIDLDTHFWTCLFMTSVWWFPMRAIKLDGPYEFEKKKIKSGVSSNIIGAIVAGILVRFSSFIPIIGDYFNIWLLFILVQLIILGFKLIHSKRLKIDNSSSIVIKLDLSFSNAISYYKKTASGLLGFFLFFALFVYLYISSNANLMTLGLVCTISALYFYFANLAHAPEFIDDVTNQQPKSNN